MLKLIKQLRPFTGSIILIFVLLLGQALADLALPDLMSRIINVGIQQNGIENPVPAAIREIEMNRILLFTGDADKAAITNDYLLLDRQKLSPPDYANYLKSYPVLADEPVYKLNTTDKNELKRLTAIFENPIMVVSYIESGAAASLLGNLPAGADPFTVLSRLPSAQIEALRQAAAGQLAQLPDSIKVQSDISYLAGEYKIIGIDVSGMQTGYIIRVGGIMLLLTLASVSASVTVGFLAARVAAGFGRNTRRRIFNKVEHFSNREFDKFSTASLITRSTNDIQQIQLVLVMMLRIIFYAPLIGVGGVIKALGQDVSMSWIIAAAVMALLAMIITTFAIAISKFRIIQKLVDRLNLVTRETLTGLMVVRAFNTQDYEEAKFDRANVDLTKTTLFINRVMVFMLPAMMFLMNAVMLLIVWVGAHQVDQGSMQVGNMMAFMQYTIQIIFAFLMVSFVFIMLPRATVSAQRISEVLETGQSINDTQSPEKFPADGKGVVEFRDVAFKYPGADDYVLQGITFTAIPGQTTAIVGGTGSGKSSIINLIPRFYDVTDGKILVDGVDIREVTQHDLRDKIGYVPQKAVLFSGTIASNIAYGIEGSGNGEVKKAAEIAQSLDFITASENGFETQVSQGGANLSGGQKQRLTIARALARKPQIYIFDDSFSAIDFKTDAALRKALKKEMGSAAVLIVTQRVSTIMNADQIVVLENGRVVGKGTHQELMAGCRVYQEFALSQLSEAELML